VPYGRHKPAWDLPKDFVHVQDALSDRSHSTHDVKNLGVTLPNKLPLPQSVSVIQNGRSWKILEPWSYSTYGTDNPFELNWFCPQSCVLVLAVMTANTTQKPDLHTYRIYRKRY